MAYRDFVSKSIFFCSLRLEKSVHRLQVKLVAVPEKKEAAEDVTNGKDADAVRSGEKQHRQGHPVRREEEAHFHCGQVGPAQNRCKRRSRHILHHFTFPRRSVRRVSIARPGLTDRWLLFIRNQS